MTFKHRPGKIAEFSELKELRVLAGTKKINLGAEKTAGTWFVKIGTSLKLQQSDLCGILNLESVVLVNCG